MKMLNDHETDVNVFSAMLRECRLCPHNCRVDRSGTARGKCRTGSGLEIASIVCHTGEEPAISGKNGICNIFFSNCNLRCVYCQNHQISGCMGEAYRRFLTMNKLLGEVIPILDQGDVSLGFVSASHNIPQMVAIIDALHKRGIHPVTVMNGNGYENASVIRMLDGIVDVYLPDFKYSDDRLAERLSSAPGYTATALASIGEMLHQKGTTLRLEEGRAVSGVIIRHLVLPGHIGNSLGVLDLIAGKLSTDVHLSLMSQYYPAALAREYPGLGRKLRSGEYKSVVNHMEELGFHRGWVQQLDSSDFYRPDFHHRHPFGED